MSWQLICIIVLIISVIQTEANRTLQLNPIILNFWRSLFATIALSLILFSPDLNISMPFILSGILTGVVSALLSTTIFHLSKQYGSKIAALSTQTNTLIIFFMWLPFDWNNFIASPLHSFSATICVLIGVGASYSLSRSPLIRRPLKILFLLSVVISISVIVGKRVLPENISMNDLLFYSFIIMATQTFVSAGAMWVRNYSFSLTPRMLKGSFGLGCVVLIGCPMSWLAIVETPNPAYFHAILMTIPIILLIYHKLFKIDDYIPLIPSIILTFSMMLLAYIS